MTQRSARGLMVLKAMREHCRNAPQAALLTMRGSVLAVQSVLVLRSPPEAGVSKDAGGRTAYPTASRMRSFHRPKGD